jgi:hypothetical protein
MLAIHHVGTITIILLYAGEFTVCLRLFAVRAVLGAWGARGVGACTAWLHVRALTPALRSGPPHQPPAQASTYRVSNAIIVLAAFALMEQPTYVALLCKRMLPANSKHVVVAARVGYISWFVLKGASVLLAVTMFVEDWHLMPTWLRVNFVLTW